MSYPVVEVEREMDLYPMANYSSYDSSVNLQGYVQISTTTPKTFIVKTKAQYITKLDYFMGWGNYSEQNVKMFWNNTKVATDPETGYPVSYVLGPSVKSGSSYYLDATSVIHQKGVYGYLYVVIDYGNLKVGYSARPSQEAIPTKNHTLTVDTCIDGSVYQPFTGVQPDYQWWAQVWREDASGSPREPDYPYPSLSLQCGTGEIMRISGAYPSSSAHFLGWYDNTSGTGTCYSNRCIGGLIEMPNSDLHLYALWTTTPVAFDWDNPKVQGQPFNVNVNEWNRLIFRVYSHIGYNDITLFKQEAEYLYMRPFFEDYDSSYSVYPFRSWIYQRRPFSYQFPEDMMSLIKNSDEDLNVLKEQFNVHRDGDIPAALFEWIKNRVNSNIG